ncbi:4Fe-4S dicluster domain-containing protein [Chloroflexota bacterium]
MKKWYLIIDVAKCENCNNCYLSCKDEYVNNDWPEYSAAQPPHQQKWIDIQTNERGQYPYVDVAYLPVPCQHCNNAPCIKASKDGAIYQRPDGIVIIDPVKSKGQRQVVSACPYGAIWWNEELEIPQKCTLCAHLLDEGWTKTRCAQSCPTGALTILSANDTELEQIIKTENLEIYHPEYKTNPRVYYKNLYRFNRCFIGGSVATRIDDTEECAAGATVTLYKTTGDKIGECLTDNYGDFKFDNLERNSGKYKMQIAYEGHNTNTIEVDLKDSLYTGVIFL